MADSYVCKRCGATGTNKEIPYKIIDTSGDRVVFKGQICEKCFEGFFARPLSTNNTSEGTK